MERKRIWFRRSGPFNWTPCTSEGWIATAGFVVFGAGGSLLLGASDRFSRTAPLWATLTLAAFLAVFVANAEWKNNGKGR